MARALSQNLRDRVIAAIDSGLSCYAAAASFGVSESSAIRWRRRALEHGQAVAKPHGGDRHSGKIEAHGVIPAMPSRMHAFFIESPALRPESGWLASHPSVDERVAALIAYAGGHDVGPEASDHPLGRPWGEPTS